MARAAPTLRVLIVADDRTIADSLALILQGRGYRVRAAYTGAGAILVAREFKPHCLVSDVATGERNGGDLAERFAKEFPECKVLLVSGNTVSRATIQVGTELIELPPTLPKPVRLQEILEYLAAIVPAD